MNKLTNKQHWSIEHAEKHPSKVFLIQSEKQITFKTLQDNTLNHASKLIEMGISENDRIGILCENNIDFIEMMLSLWMIGAIPVLLSTRNTIFEIEALVKSIEIKSLIVHNNLNNNFPSTGNTSIYNFPFEVTNKNIRVHKKEFHLKNNALILFTSGSTKKPKAVLHTFSNLYESTLLTNLLSELTENDKWLASLPLYHIGGFMIFVRALLTGSSIVFLDSLRAESISSAMKEHNPTHISLVSTVLKQILEMKVKPNSNLKQLYLGGGPLTKELCAEAVKKGFPIVKVYGSTETCSMIAALPAHQFINKPYSVGKPIGDTEIKIVDEYKNSIEANHPGEVVIKSNSNFKEYINNQKLSKKILLNDYFYSGDYGYLDEDGFLYIESRREDLIISGGENINPKEVENAILCFPGVKDVYVFAEEDENWAQIVCAAIVSDNKTDKDSLANHLKTKIAAYKIPKKFYFVNEIPKNEMGKVQKEKLIENLISNSG